MVLVQTTTKYSLYLFRPSQLQENDSSRTSFLQVSLNQTRAAQSLFASKPDSPLKLTANLKRCCGSNRAVKHRLCVRSVVGTLHTLVACFERVYRERSGWFWTWSDWNWLISNMTCFAQIFFMNWFLDCYKHSPLRTVSCQWYVLIWSDLSVYVEDTTA